MSIKQVNKQSMNIGTRKSIITGGKEISVETGKLANKRMVLLWFEWATPCYWQLVVAAQEAKEGVDFFH
jgi:polyribonucleotide nucleotidyltransferase